MKNSVRLITFFLLSFYFLQILGVIFDERIHKYSIQTIIVTLITYQILILLIYYFIYNTYIIKRERDFFSSSKLTVALFILFITVEVTALLLFLKEGIPIFDVDPGGAKLRIADGNGLYIRYIKYFGNIVTFSLIILIQSKFKKNLILACYFMTIVFFGYRSELILLIIQYILLVSMSSNPEYRISALKKVLICVTFFIGTCGLFYMSLGQDGQINSAYDNIKRIMDRLTIEQVESVPYVINESIEHDFFPTPELGNEINAIYNRVVGEKDHSLFFGERLHKIIFGDMGANFLSVTTYGAELLVFLGPLSIFIIPLGLWVPFILLKRMSKTHSAVNFAIYSYVIMIFMQYLVAGNASAFTFGPLLTIVIMGLPLVLLNDLLKRY